MAMSEKIKKDTMPEKITGEDWQMGKARNSTGILYPFGVTPVEGGVKILVQAAGEKCCLLLFRQGEEKACEKIEFKDEERTGDVWSMTLCGRQLDDLEYCFEVDGDLMADPYGKSFSGSGKWADLKEILRVPKSRFGTEPFDWEGDCCPEIPFSDTVLYRLHVRGFTKHASSGVKNGGTFSAVEEKIPYIKELGVTAVELMPAVEFEEVMMPQEMPGNPYGKTGPTGVINYWGYGPAFLFAPKAAYGLGEGEKPETELKRLIKGLHKNGMECILELYFTGKETPQTVLDVLRFWVQDYHVDGFRLSGFVPVDMVADDPFLSRTKLFAENWESALGRRPRKGYAAPGDGKVTLREKHLAEYNDQFQNDMRRFLKGDEEMMNALSFRNRRNPSDYAVINYMANTNGFTMMDMVSYDRKHNEKNGEDNRDGNDYNYSWNCGAEGPSRKKKIVQLRRKQLRNAFLLLFLSQGTPLFLAGDEFGNSQNGNNNAYCQDNEISWLNWKLLDSNRDLYEFVKYAAAFRRRHPVFHMEREPRLMDYKSCGRPDMSYHGENAWKPEFENFRRQMGILYWGPYGTTEDGKEDTTFYVAYNMHWEPHVFGLPRLPNGQMWHVSFDTSRDEVHGFYQEGKEPALKNQNQTVIPPRSIVVLCSKNSSGYYTYETLLGEITICCRDGALTGMHFGRIEQKDTALKETRTQLTDEAFRQLMEYLEGTRKEFDLPLSMAGTVFQKKVWKALTTIPYGETRSYKEIAVQIGEEKASRAVGMANNKNPIGIVVPCHRVIGASGSLVGYGGGLDIKTRLLELEKSVLEKEAAGKTETELFNN